MVGDTIRRLRREKGLSKTELGNLCGLNSVIISAFENGTRKPDLEQLSKIAEGLGVSVRSMLENSESSAEMSIPIMTEYLMNNTQHLRLLQKTSGLSPARMNVLLSVADSLAACADTKITYLGICYEDRQER